MFALTAEHLDDRVVQFTTTTFYDRGALPDMDKIHTGKGFRGRLLKQL